MDPSFYHAILATKCSALGGRSRALLPRCSLSGSYSKSATSSPWLADHPPLGAGSGPGRIRPLRARQDPLGAVQPGVLDVSLRGGGVLSWQKAALSSSRTRISSSVPPISVSFLPLIAFLCPVQAVAFQGSCTRGSSRLLPGLALHPAGRKLSAICLGKSCWLLVFFFLVGWGFFYF